MMNIINTFKNPNGGTSPTSKAFRWTQSRCLEFGKAVSVWATCAPHECARCRSRVADLLQATFRGGRVHAPFHHLRLDCRRSWDRKLKPLCIQIRDLLRIALWRLPGNIIATGISGRCHVLAACALAEAVAAEKLECSTSKSDWKPWVQQACNSSAAVAHNYSKQALLLCKTGAVPSPAEMIP